MKSNTDFCDITRKILSKISFIGTAENDGTARKGFVLQLAPEDKDRLKWTILERMRTTTPLQKRTQV